MSEPDWIEATRASYDLVAEDYARLLGDPDARSPLDRALLAVFVEHTLEPGTVLDLGCGPGVISRFLWGLDCDVVGIDLSPGMVKVARRSHPQIPFEVGSLTAIDRPDASAVGVLAWYSLIHLPTPELPGALAEIARVLQPGAPFLTAFQVGDTPHVLTEGYGHEVDLVNHQRTLDQVAALLDEAGIAVTTRVVAEPEEGQRTQQAYLLGIRR